MGDRCQSITNLDRLKTIERAVRSHIKALDGATAESQFDLLSIGDIDPNVLSQVIADLEIAGPVMDWYAEGECQLDHHGICQNHGGPDVGGTSESYGKCSAEAWKNRNQTT